MDNRKDIFTSTVNLSKEREESYKNRRSLAINKIIQKRYVTTQDNDVHMQSPEVNLEVIKDSLNYLFLPETQRMKLTEIKKLKALRKELSKSDVSKELIVNLLSSYPNLIQNLTMYLLDFKNSEIQFETIWILNNLSIYCYKFNLECQFEQISKILVEILKMENRFSNNGVKNLIYEKFFCLIGNLIFIDEKTLIFFLNNNIIPSIFKNLNSMVCSLRCVCLWSLNKILKEIMRINSLRNYLELFVNKDAIYYYQFILKNFENKINFDEVYEFYWLINELFKFKPELGLLLFFSDKEKEVKKKFENLLSICLIYKVLQPCIRLISNLIAIGKTHPLIEILCNLIIDNVPIANFIKDVLSNKTNKYDEGVVRDTIVLLFNLTFFIPQKCYSAFYNEICEFMITKNSKEMSNSETLKMLIQIYYTSIVSGGCQFLEKDKAVIGEMIKGFNLYCNNVPTCIAMCDLLFAFAKFFNLRISDLSQNGMQAFLQNSNLSVEEVNIILKDLINTVI